MPDDFQVIFGSLVGEIRRLPASTETPGLVRWTTNLEVMSSVLLCGFITQLFYPLEVDKMIFFRWDIHWVLVCQLTEMPKPKYL